MNASATFAASSSEMPLGSYPVRSILNSATEGNLSFTTLRLVLSWSGRSCAVPLSEITQLESSGGSGSPVTLNFVSKAVLSTTYRNQGIDDHDIRTDLGERIFTSLAKGIENAANAGRRERGMRTTHTTFAYDAQTRELRKKLRHDAFFDPAGHSMGISINENTGKELKDLLCRLCVIRHGGDVQSPLVDLPDSSLRLIHGEDVIWAYRSPTRPGFVRLLKDAPSTLYLTNFRLIEECKTNRSVRIREVFPENIRAIRWQASKSSQPGSFSVEPEGPALFRFVDAGAVYSKDVPSSYKYFVEVDRPGTTSPLEEFGARLVSLQQGLASGAPLRQVPNVPVSLAREEEVRYTDGLSASGGVQIEMWMTNFRLIVRCSGHNHSAMCEVMIDPSVRVNCVPTGAAQGTLAVIWGKETLQREKLNLISPAPLTNMGSLGPFEWLYRNLGVIPSRQLIGFSIPGPLIIPAPLSEGTSLADRVSKELVAAGRGTHAASVAAETRYNAPVQGPIQQASVQADEVLRTYSVRLGGDTGPAGQLQITHSRLKIFDGDGGPNANLLWQASLPEIRQFLRTGSGDTVSTVIITSNPVLSGGGQREKKKLGPLFDYTGRYPVLQVAGQTGRELGALCLELLDRGELVNATSTSADSCPSALAPHETVCRHYDLGLECGVWLTTHRLILYRSNNETTIWECALSDLEGIEQWRINGSVVDLHHAMCVGAVAVPLLLSAPSLGSVLGVCALSAELYSLFKPKRYSYLVPVTGSSWGDRGEDSSGEINIGPPRPDSGDSRNTEAVLRRMTIPVAGTAGEQMWRELGSALADLRARGEQAAQDLTSQPLENSNLLDSLPSAQDERLQGDWKLPGPRRGKGYVGRVALTDKRLLVQRRISASGWSTETIWQTLISPQTRLETVPIHTLYGTRSGPLHGLAQSFRVVFGLGVLFFPLLIASLVATSICYILASPRSVGGLLGLTAAFIGIFALLSRSLSRAMREGPEVLAVTVLPRPWSRPRVVGGLPHSGSEQVRFGSNLASATPQAAQDPIRPYKFLWGIRRLYPPTPAAPLVPVPEDVGANVAMEVNQALDRIRAGCA
jgi:hypothetical protein